MFPKTVFMGIYVYKGGFFVSEKQQFNNVSSFAPINELDIEKIEQLMDYAFYEKHADIKELRELLKTYKELKKENAENSAVAWNDFIQNYSMYEEIFPDIPCAQHSSKQTAKMKKQRKDKGFYRLWRYGLVAAVFFVLCTIFFNTTAMGGSIWQSIARWNSEVFSFTNKTAPAQINDELILLHDTLTTYEITEKVAPTWIPDGFVLTEFSAVELSTKTIFHLLLNDKERLLLIEINSLIELSGNMYEKSDGEVYEFNRNGVTHYIMQNESWVTVVWRNGNYESNFSGDISVVEAEMMINSIYER